MPRGDAGPFNGLVEQLGKRGATSAHADAKRLLDEAWEAHRPDATAAMVEFERRLLAAPGVTIAAVMGKEWKPRVRAFAYNEHYLIRQRYESRAGEASATSRLGVPPRLTLPYNTTAPIKKSQRAIRDRKRRGVVLIKAELDQKTGVVTLVSQLPASLRGFAEWTAERALVWCESQEGFAQAKLAQVAQVRLWCAQVPDPRKPLGDQLTAQIIASLHKEAA